MSKRHAMAMVSLILASVMLSTGCAERERPVPTKPQVDPRLKEKCPRPVSLPPRGKATYLDLMIFSVNAEITMDCSDRKIEDLGKSID